MADNSGDLESTTCTDDTSETVVEKIAETTKEQDKSDESDKEASTNLVQKDTEESSAAKKLKSDSDTETPATADPDDQEGEMVGATADVSGDGPIPATKSSDSSHIFTEEWSQLPKDVIVDKIKGIIYGQAIGDALGLATEFMTHKMAQTYYGKKGPSKYEDIVQDFHRSRWQAGDWTDDTDQMLLILLMIVERGGQIDKLDFASRIHDWMKNGFKELGDYVCGMGIGMTVHQTLVHPLFLKEPHTAATETWEKSGRYLAANGAIMRTSILGALNFNDIEKVVSNTVEICKVTHADPRCSASCIAVTTAIALMLQGKFNPTDKHELKNLVEASLKEADKVLEHDDQQKEMKKHVMASSLDKLKLDDKHTIGYTFKALGAGFYALRNAKDFRKSILEVVMQAGDADSNAAVAGALVGCKFGFSSLPQDLLQFPHREWLDQRVDSFLEVIGLKDKTNTGASP